MLILIFVVLAAFAVYFYFESQKTQKLLKDLNELLKKQNGNDDNLDPSVRDELYDDAVELVAGTGKTSASFLQKKLRVGYARARHLLDLLEENGIVGAAADPDEYVDEDLDSPVNKAKGKFRKAFDFLNLRYEEIGTPTISPSVISYHFIPQKLVGYKKVVKYMDELALTLNAHPLRLVPPEKDSFFYRIEVPREDKEIVYLKNELNSDEYKQAPGILTIPLGVDCDNVHRFIDLAELPHVLIGGATGSGKSMFLHSVICSLIQKFTEKELKFILIDPKRVEFPVYNKNKYLLTEVIQEPSKAVEQLELLLGEMDRRFELLASSEAGNIKDYNEKATEKMSYLIVIVDELADLMVSDGKKCEESIVKFAQMGRAVGIHLLLSTARPCDEVFTEEMRGNIVSRMAFSTASIDDSNIMLDHGGAEKLIGHGDVLLRDYSHDQELRMQTPYISDEDISALVKDSI